MKKQYLMSGAVALMLGAMAVSCSNDIETYSLQEQKAAEYEAAFVQTFGKISKTQDWGFGGSTRTRANVNVNGNMWVSMPEVSPTEKKKVFDFVNMTLAEMKAAEHNYTEVFPENLTNYWVSQVWTGEDTYQNLDKNKPFVGSEHMDNLHIQETKDGSISDTGVLSEGDWFHVNNFNRGDNTDWSGNTLITEAGTYDFAYNCSEDSKYHNKWIAVDGKDIDPSLAGYYYVCFDFIAVPNGCQTVFERISENGAKYYADGAWDSAADVIDAGLKFYQEGWNGEKTVRTYYDIDVTDLSEPKQVVSGNMAVKANNVYTDWIIRLVKATPKDDNEQKTVQESGRIICEDMGTIGDFDFNDVVFDAEIYTDGTCSITLLAAGGTLPITVAGESVADHLGTMSNTGLTPATPYTFTAKGYPTLKDIPIVVSTTDEAGNVTSYELTAEIGKAPQKICVPQSYKWCDEYVSIKKAYPSFVDWVSGQVAGYNWDWLSSKVVKYTDLELSNND